MRGCHRNAELGGKVGKTDALSVEIFAKRHTCEFRTVRNFAQRGISQPRSGAQLAPGPQPRMVKVLSNLHTHLRSWRRHKRLTLEQLAALIGSKTNTISGWETGNRGVDLDDIKKLADAYGVHPAALLFSPGDQSGFEAMRDVFEMASSMTPEARSAWVAIGKQLRTTRD